MNDKTIELRKFSDLIGLIYEGATDPNRWTHDILPAVAEYIGAPECILFTNMHAPQHGGYFFIHGITQDHVDLYMNKYLDQDVWTISALKNNLLTEGSILTGDELVPRQQLLDSSFYKNCLSRDRNMAQLLVAVVFGTESGSSMPTVLSFFRGLHHPDFNQNDIERVRLIMPHLSRSLGVMQRLKTAELKVATSMAALNRLPTGVLLLDSSGTVSFANHAAIKIFNQNDGLQLRKLSHSASLGKLMTEHAEVNRTLDQSIGATLNRHSFDTPHFSNCIKVPRLSMMGSYELHISLLGEHAEFGGNIEAYSGIIFILDKLDGMSVDLIDLQNTYGLTPTEAKVASMFIHADSAQEVADQIGTSLNTVRTQLKQIYAKLGVNSRTRFVKLMMGMSKSQPQNDLLS